MRKSLLVLLFIMSNSLFAVSQSSNIKEDCANKLETLKSQFRKYDLDATRSRIATRIYALNVLNLSNSLLGKTEVSRLESSAKKLKDYSKDILSYNKDVISNLNDLNDKILNSINDIQECF